MHMKTSLCGSFRESDSLLQKHLPCRCVGRHSYLQWFSSVRDASRNPRIIIVVYFRNAPGSVRFDHFFLKMFCLLVCNVKGIGGTRITQLSTYTHVTNNENNISGYVRYSNGVLTRRINVATILKTGWNDKIPVEKRMFRRYRQIL